MTNKEKIIRFNKYLNDLDLEKETVDFYMNVVERLTYNVLYFFNEGLENIDTFTFEEFTDKVNLIDEAFGGRDGIPRMLEAMLVLTEFLKKEGLIKGGKIAHYKRMFSKAQYYIDKYDRLTGRKDDSKEFIRDILSNRFSSNVLNILEEFNVYGCSTLIIIDKLLNDIPLDERDKTINLEILKKALVDAKLIEENGSIIETTKKGRLVSRLQAEEQYAAILYIFIYIVNWERVISDLNLNSKTFDFRLISRILATTLNKQRKVQIDFSYKEELKKEEVLVEIASDSFRLGRIEIMPYGSNVVDICFKGLGMIKKGIDIEGNLYYQVSDLGQKMFKAMHNETLHNIKMHLEIIELTMKNKKYNEAENMMIEFLSTFGGNIVVWAYLGQILLLDKKYNYAYHILKHAYENSSKRGKWAKTVLYHLVLCCRKLKFNEEIDTYEKKLEGMSRV